MKKNVEKALGKENGVIIFQMPQTYNEINDNHNRIATGEMLANTKLKMALCHTFHSV